MISSEHAISTEQLQQLVEQWPPMPAVVPVEPEPPLDLSDEQLAQRC